VRHALGVEDGEVLRELEARAQLLARHQASLAVALPIHDSIIVRSDQASPTARPTNL